MISKQALSTRQLECMHLVREGMTSKEISRTLGISRHTVDGHIQGALNKMGAGRRKQAAILTASNLRLPQVATNIIATAIEGLIECLDAMQQDVDLEDDDPDAEHDGREDVGPCI